MHRHWQMDQWSRRNEPVDRRHGTEPSLSPVTAARGSDAATERSAVHETARQSSSGAVRRIQPRGHGRWRLIVAILLAIGGSVAAAGMSRADEGSRSGPRSPPLANYVLRPGPGSGVDLGPLVLRVRSDGSRELQLELHLAAGERTRLFYAVDSEELNYWVWRLGSSVPADSLEADGNAPSSPPGTECLYRAHAEITHYDPALIPLASTEQTVDWLYDSVSTCVTYVDDSDVCWANPETDPPFFPPTHWFVDSCNGSWFYTGGSLPTGLSDQRFGDYSNWDWGDPGIRTWVHHTILISVLRRSASFNLIHSDGGEDHQLIFGVIDTSVFQLQCY